jgi:peptide/nickel transport system permease protein
VLIFIVRRMLAAVPVLLALSVPMFLLLHIGPADPAVLLLGESADAASLAEQRQMLGLDQPMPVQYAQWLVSVLHGDLGRSLRTHQSVTEAILARLPVTMELAVLSLTLGLLVGLPLGIFAAARPHSLVDLTSRLLGVVGVAIPTFFFGLLLILVFSLWLRVLPPSGYAPFTQDPGLNLKLMLLPTVTLGLALAATVARTTRASVLETVFFEFVLAARSKGLSERVVLLRHVVRNALLPVVTIVGLQFGALLGGAIFVEVVFALPGIGRLVVDSVFARDFPVVQGSVLFLGLMRIISSIGVDVAYATLDPRIALSD